MHKLLERFPPYLSQAGQGMRRERGGRERGEHTEKEVIRETILYYTATIMDSGKAITI